MTQLKIASSLRAFYEALIFTEAALEAYEPVQAIAAPVTAHIAGFEPLNKAELELARAEQKLLARIRVGDLWLDRSLRDLQIDLLSEVRQDRSAPAYTSIYKAGITEVVKYGLAKQVEIAHDAHIQLTRDGAPYTKDLIDKHAPALQKAILNGQKLLEERRLHELAAADLRLQLLDWKQDANAVLLAVEGELLAHAAKNDEPRAWARNFFG